MASSPKIDELRKKFEENPRRYFAPLANEYRKAGDLEQAIAICREYLPQQPGHMSGHIVFGQALFEAKKLDEAKTTFETALTLDPENLIALKHLGDISFAEGDKNTAKSWYKRVLDADPRNEEAAAQMAILEPQAVPAPTPAATATSPTQAMPAAKPGPASSAPTVVMQAMRPLPKLGATGVPMPAVPKPGTATPAVTPAAPAAPTPPAAAVAQTQQIPTMSNASTVPIKVPPAVAPTQEMKLEGFSSGADSAHKVEPGSSAVAATVIMEAAPGMKPVSAAEVPAVAPTLGLETTSLGASEPPPIGGFSLEGLETTSMAPPPTASPAAPTAPAAADAGTIDLDFAAPAPAAPPAPVAAAPTPEIELDIPAAPAPAAPAAPTADLPMIDLDMPAAAPAPVAPPPPAAPVPVAAAADGDGLVDLAIDIPAPAAPVAAAPPPPAAPAAPPAPIVPVAAAPARPAPEPAPVDLEIETPAPAPAPDSGPFVTETMAELYLKQGHRDEALRVYRALLEQRPGDAGLLAKVAELSGAAVPAPMAEPGPEMPALPHVDGPSIRSVLMLIAMRRPGYRPDAAEGNGTAAHVESAHHTPDAETPHGADSLSHLWNHAAPPAIDEGAALMLLAAFHDLDGHTHGNGALDFSGAAAEAAATRAATAAALASGAPAAPSSFSFDKFFSQRATAEHAAQGSKPGPAGAPAESQEDQAKFSQWLEGLKQK